MLSRDKQTASTCRSCIDFINPTSQTLPAQWTGRGLLGTKLGWEHRRASMIGSVGADRCGLFCKQPLWQKSTFSRAPEHINLINMPGHCLKASS
jgi:hypothetical protein